MRDENNKLATEKLVEASENTIAAFHDSAETIGVETSKAMITGGLGGKAAEAMDFLRLAVNNLQLAVDDENIAKEMSIVDDITRIIDVYNSPSEVTPDDIAIIYTHAKELHQMAGKDPSLSPNVAQPSR